MTALYCIADFASGFDDQISRRPGKRGVSSQGWGGGGRGRRGRGGRRR